MIKLNWLEEKTATDPFTTLFTSTPLGKATIEPEECYDGIGMVYHVYLAGAYMGHLKSIDEAKQWFSVHLQQKARELLGQTEPLTVDREALTAAMTTLAQGQYNMGADAVFTILEAAFREAAKKNPDMMISFDDAVTFVLAIRLEAFK